MLSIASSTPKQYPFVELGVVSVWQILAQKENPICAQHLKQARDEKRDPPGREFVGTHFQDEFESYGHDQLSGTPTEVSPSPRNTVCCSDDRSGKQGAHPELCGHKSCQ